uniref:Uncharacterized protein n=1 Tax=Arundo donax TaxID=35708 RepID=A0A0A9BKN7_ARUDO
MWECCAIDSSLADRFGIVSRLIWFI